MKKRTPFLFLGIGITSLLLSIAVVSANGDILIPQKPTDTLGPPTEIDGQVAGVTTVKDVPVLSEKREAAVEFTPYRKAAAYNLSVPSAHAAILLDATTGMTLYENHAHDHRAIASLTKLMTTMIVVETVKDLDEPVTVDEEAVYADGTRVGCPRSGYCVGERLHPGERISVKNLLHAALMNSANDAAIALGKHLDGTQEQFAMRMNNRAKELGLSDTHFCTPSGLEIDGRESECYSSAHDIAAIAAYALRYPILWEIMRSEPMTIASLDGKYQHSIFNTDEILGKPNLIGTKTGFTPEAGRSLLAVSNNSAGKHPLVAVVLDDQSRWQSVQTMLDWGYHSFEWQ